MGGRDEEGEGARGAQEGRREEWGEGRMRREREIDERKREEGERGGGGGGGSIMTSGDKAEE